MRFSSEMVDEVRKGLLSDLDAGKGVMDFAGEVDTEPEMGKMVGLIVSTHAVGNDVYNTILSQAVIATAVAMKRLYERAEKRERELIGLN